MTVLTAQPPTQIETTRRVSIKNGSDLEAMRNEWSQLLRRSAVNNPMLSPDWLLTWREFYAEGTIDQVAAMEVREGERLVGLALMQLRNYRHHRIIPFRRIELFGAETDVADGVCPEYLGLVAENGREAQVSQHFVQALVDGEFGQWDEAVFSMMAGDGPWPSLLADGFSEAGFATETDTSDEAPYITLPNSWNDYLAMLPENDQTFLCETLADFEQWTGGEETYHLARTPSELSEGNDILRRLHRARWHAAGGGGAFDSPRFTAFHDAMMQTFLEKGALELHWLNVRNEPIAAIYNIVWDGKVFFYQSGRSIKTPDNIRPGIVLQAHCIQRAIEQGLREYDFLSGGSQYKQRLGPLRRKLLEVRVVRSKWRERLRRTVQKFGS